MTFHGYKAPEQLMVKYDPLTLFNRSSRWQDQARGRIKIVAVAETYAAPHRGYRRFK